MRSRIDTLRSHPNCLPVIDVIVRLCLALSIAFVFAGRMEAAAAHCAKIAATEVAATAADPEAMPCHDGDDAAAAESTGHHSAPQQTPATDACECIAVLKACSAIMAASASARIEPYEWMRPESAAFVSNEPAPALRPPRA